MEKLNEPFKLDKKNIYYIDSRDVKVQNIHFREIGKLDRLKRGFFKIEGIDDYIIKDSTMYPLLFNGIRNRKLLSDLVSKIDLLPDIGFPIGYYQSRGRMKGTIIPYYDNAIPLRKMIYLFKFEELKDYYYRDNDDIYNLISLLLDILNLISRMYDNNVSYLDIHSGNFLIYNNDIKVIDFDYDYVFFNQNMKYYHTIMRNYSMLVETICRRFGFKEILFNGGDTFFETECRVKCLRRELER